MFCVDSYTTQRYSRHEFPSYLSQALNAAFGARKFGMRQDSGCLGNQREVPCSLCIIACILLLNASPAHAQTQQPYLFATTQVNSNSAVATFTRNDATGALSEVAGSPFVLLTAGCYPSTIEPKARYLLGSCGDGISLYQFNSATGVVSEVPNSPFAASSGTAPQAVIAEATGQYAYALRVTSSTFPVSSTATLDSFTIDATNNVLSHPSSQNLTLPGSFLGLIVDPNGHFIQIFLAQPGGATMSMGGSCAIRFDPQTGLPVTSNSGLCQPGVAGGTNPLGISIDARGTFIGTWARGQIYGGFDVFAISPSDGSIQGSGNYLFSQTNENLGGASFDPTGALIYVNSGLSGLRIFALSVAQSTVTISELPSSPLPSNVDPTPLYALADPAADFTFVGGSNAITTYPIDTTTGYPGTPIQSAFNHNPALNFQPIFATMPPAGQAVSAPAASLSTQSLSFGPTNPGQPSGPQTVTISSTGNEALTINSVATSPSGGPFSETDSCMTNPVLAPGTSCQIFISYAPSTTGVTQAALVISDNAAGSPQSVSLTGTAVAPPPPAPQVTLLPGTLTFPGTTTQGESSAAQSITITNSGNATLTFTSAPILNGVNTADFSINSNSCTGALAANASCSVGVIFSPLAAGVRTTNLVLADNATGSPQSATINGNALAAATFVTQSGASASVSAGQPATFSLQASPGAGFSGALNFACSGAPTGATCSAPSVTVASGSTTNFSVIVTTSGSAMLAPHSLPKLSLPTGEYSEDASLLFALLSCWFFLALRPRSLNGTRFSSCALVVMCGMLALAGCGGGGSSPQPQPAVTPSGTYIITVTPTATPSGSAKNLSLNPITLTLIVK